MSLGLTKPGASVALRHPKTGAIIEPIGYVRGKAVWPVLGASSDDEDDPTFTGGGGGEGGSSRRQEVEDDDDDEDDQDDETDDEDEEDEPSKSKKEDTSDKSKASRQAAKYRVERNEARKQLADLQERLRKIEDSDKPADELMKRDLDEARDRVTTLTERARSLALENAFLKANSVQWEDPSDALKLIDFDEIDVDEDGTVDARQLSRALRDLAKRKPHLVKKSKTSGQDNEDDDEPSSRSSASPMNKRRGQPKGSTSRDALKKRFPVLGR